MKMLREELGTLCLFRDLLKEPVISDLYNFLGERTAYNYVEFVSALYEYGQGDLGKYVMRLCNKSENSYVKTVGKGQTAPNYMKEALIRDLEILQKLVALDRDCLCGELLNGGNLPEFFSANIDLKAEYLKRIENVGRYGYGIYAGNHMFYVDEAGKIVPTLHPDMIRLSDLVDYEAERQIVYDNTKALLLGRPAANMLLTGDAGTGKSSTVKAVANALWQEGLRLVEIRKDQLAAIPKVLSELSENPMKFVLFIDDLSFSGDDDNFNGLKSALEGSVTMRSGNVVIYATSNRRHVVKERFSDRQGDDIHCNDTIQEMVSLSGRFGIHVSFSKPDKKTFLNIVNHLAEASGIRIIDGAEGKVAEVNGTEKAEQIIAKVSRAELDMLAERFALERGGRSARLARQFVDNMLARI